MNDPIVKHVPEGTLSTIIIPDRWGVVVGTILFDHNGNMVKEPQRTYLSFEATITEHYQNIGAQLDADALLAQFDGEGA